MTADELIAAVKVRAQIPSYSQTFTDTVILNLANDEMQNRLAPLVMRNRENFYLMIKDYTIGSNNTTYTMPDHYRIPARAIGGKLRAVSVTDSGGAETPLPDVGTEGVESGLFGFCVEGNSVILSDAVIGFTTLRLRYFHRPNLMTLASSGLCKAITTVTGPPYVLTVATSHSINSIDIIKGTGNFEPIAIEQSWTATAGTFLYTFGNTRFVTAPEVGDYMCRSGYSNYPQLPLDLHPVLAQRVTVTVLEAGGYLQEAESARKSLKSMEDDMHIVLSPRVDSTQKKIKNSSLGF